MNRFLIAGTGSGCGKTTVTCAVLAALRQRGLNIASFKCGPDYIDPMFHAAVIGTSAHNLDSFFCPPDILRGLLAEYSRDADVSVLEGVMGFYDGSDGSAYAVSELTETPVVLIIDCKGMSDSIGAVMQGFLHYKTPNRIAGFIFNRLPSSLEGLAKCHTHNRPIRKTTILSVRYSVRPLPTSCITAKYILNSSKAAISQSTSVLMPA